IYRGASSHTQHQIVDVCGFHRAGTAALAMSLPNCPLSAPPPSADAGSTDSAVSDAGARDSGASGTFGETNTGDVLRAATVDYRRLSRFSLTTTGSVAVTALGAW